MDCSVRSAGLGSVVLACVGFGGVGFGGVGFGGVGFGGVRFVPNIMYYAKNHSNKQRKLAIAFN